MHHRPLGDATVKRLCKDLSPSIYWGAEGQLLCFDSEWDWVVVLIHAAQLVFWYNGSRPHGARFLEYRKPPVLHLRSTPHLLHLPLSSNAMKRRVVSEEKWASGEDNKNKAKQQQHKKTPHKRKEYMLCKPTDVRALVLIWHLSLQVKLSDYLFNEWR